MISRITRLIVATIATALVSTFVLGLAYSISSGFAGFWGGFPFWVIAVFVLLMAVYDLWEECIKKN